MGIDWIIEKYFDSFYVIIKYFKVYCCCVREECDSFSFVYKFI